MPQEKLTHQKCQRELPTATQEVPEIHGSTMQMEPLSGQAEHRNTMCACVQTVNRESTVQVVCAGM